MTHKLSPVQRLAVSRTLIAHALRDPVWVILVQRLLKERATTKSAPPAHRS